MARVHTDLFRQEIAGAGVAQADPAYTGGATGRLPIQPQSPGLGKRIWWGAGTCKTAIWAAQQGMNLMSSTLLTEDTGVPFDQLQAEQISQFRQAWADDGHDWEPRVSVSRSALPIFDDETRGYFGAGSSAEGRDQVGMLDGARSRFGKSYMGEPDVLAAELVKDEAVQSADTLMLTVPNQLGVEFNARLLESVARDVAPALGWAQ